MMVASVEKKKTANFQHNIWIFMDIRSFCIYLEKANRILDTNEK